MHLLTKFKPESRFRLSELIYIRETEHAQLTFTDFNYAIKCCYPEKNVTELPIGPLKFLNNVHNNAINYSKMANSQVSITVSTGLSTRQVQALSLHGEQEPQEHNSGIVTDITPLVCYRSRVAGHKLDNFSVHREITLSLLFFVTPGNITT